MSTVVDKIRASLSWRGLNGRKAEHIVLKRERAVELLDEIRRMQLRLEALEDLDGLCDGCGVNRRDEPSRLCPGCQAYEDHTR